MIKLRIIAVMLFMLIVVVSNKTSYAQCINCTEPQCRLAQGNVPVGHNGGMYIPADSTRTNLSPADIRLVRERGGAVWRGFIPNREVKILTDWRNAFSCYRSWLVGDDKNACLAYCESKLANYDAAICNNQLRVIPRFWEDTVLNGFMGLAEQMSAVTMQSAYTIGKFFDAKAQLETQRVLQVKQFEAHRDYMPSENICLFGSAANVMPGADNTYNYSKLGISKVQLKRALGEKGRSGAKSPDGDLRARWDLFRSKYCDPADNNWVHPENRPPGVGNKTNGLTFVCPSKGAFPNADIDYTRTVDQPRSLQGGSEKEFTDNEQAVLSLSYNLYGHNALSRLLSSSQLRTEAGQQYYFKLRSIEAKRAVARNSFNSIIALKSQIPANNDFFNELYKGLGLPNMSDENPPASRYMMLEAMTNKIYQSPSFFSNLYDKPANVARMSVAMKASELMVDRAMFESELRQEMALSVLLTARQNEKLDRLNKMMGNRLRKSVGGQ